LKRIPVTTRRGRSGRGGYADLVLDFQDADRPRPAGGCEMGSATGLPVEALDFDDADEAVR
jgi:hypothetical protein